MSYLTSAFSHASTFVGRGVTPRVFVAAHGLSLAVSRACSSVVQGPLVCKALPPGAGGERGVCPDHWRADS